MKQRSEKKTIAATLPPVLPALPEEKTRFIRQRDTVTKTDEFKTLAEQAARSTICFKNWYVDEMRERYRTFDRMKRIDRAFPYAKLNDTAAPCMVFFDEPKTETDLEICYQKAPILRSLGYKYAIIESDSTLFDVLEQLGAV